MMPRVPSKLPEGLLFALTLFGPFAFGCVEPWSRAALEILAFSLALACYLMGNRAASRMGAAFWSFPAGFAALGAVQLLAAVPPDAPRPGVPFTAAPHETEAAVLLWVSYAALVWSVPRVLITHGAARRYARLLFWLGVALAALGLLQSATGSDHLYWLRFNPNPGEFGPYYNRDHAANVLLMALAVGVGLIWSTPKRWPETDGPSREYLRAQGFLAAGLIAILMGLVVCKSRGAFLAISLAGTAVAFLGAGFAESPNRRRAIAAAALGAAAGIVLLAIQNLTTHADAGALIESSTATRLQIYGDAWRWWRNSPFFGTGLGSFTTVYPSYQDLTIIGIVPHAHCDWIELALQAGILGLIAALSGAALAAFHAAQTWHRARSSEMRALIGGALAATAAFAAHVLLDFCFQIPGNAVLFLGIVGFLLSAPSWADKAAEPASVRVPRALPGVLAAGACFLLLTWSAVEPAVAAWRADAPGDRQAQAAAHARAFSLDPVPGYLVVSAAALYDAAGEGGRDDVTLLRSSLKFSMAAMEQRPFDFAALYYAGASLGKLGRPADGIDLIQRSEKVRFSPPDDVVPTEPDNLQRRRDGLQTLNFLLRKGHKR